MVEDEDGIGVGEGIDEKGSKRVWELDGMLRDIERKFGGEEVFGEERVVLRGGVEGGEKLDETEDEEEEEEEEEYTEEAEAEEILFANCNIGSES